MKKIKITYIITIFLIIVVIIVITNIKIYIVKTGSMEPSLRINEMIIVKNKKKNTKYQIGDIVTYIDRESGMTVTHRIVDIIEDKIYTKGDYNNYRDINYIKYDDIVGEVIGHTYVLGVLYSKYKFQILLLICIYVNIYQAIEKRKNYEI